jgi:hypothetical protein
LLLSFRALLLSETPHQCRLPGNFPALGIV